MARVKGGNIHKKRRVKVLKLAKGYFGSKHKLYKSAKEQVMHSLKYAYRDRRQNKREMRKLWITRINAACRNNDISYSKFINGLNKAGITINRKMLSEVAIDNPKAFTSLVELARSGKVKETKKTVIFLSLYPNKPINTPILKRIITEKILNTNPKSTYLSFMTQACLQDPSMFKI